jgi:hypothetical protein
MCQEANGVVILVPRKLMKRRSRISYLSWRRASAVLSSHMTAIAAYR